MQGITLYRNSSGWKELEEFSGLADKIRYNPHTGLFYYIYSFTEAYEFRGETGLLETAITVYEADGQACFTNVRGYKSVKIGNGYYIHAHILAWYLYYGERPSTRLTWVNDDRTDNRIVNLCDPLTNQWGYLLPEDLNRTAERTTSGTGDLF